MKILNLFALTTAFSLLSCAKSNLYTPSKTKVSSFVSTGKKGADFSTNTTNGTWWANTINLQSHWFYTWGLNIPVELAPQNCEFVPMFWGKTTVNETNINQAKLFKTNGIALNILGFNEPDLKDQSNMTVAEALALWPQLESIGLPLGSPATSWPTRQWNYDFLDQAIAQGKRIDFIPVHMYVGTDDVAFVKVLQELYDKYQKPIWITEFATVSEGAKVMSDNRYTPEMVLAFMKRLLPKLEALPFVQRYSWFSGSPTSARLWPSALIDQYGNLTPLGKWYSEYKPNTEVKR